MDKNIDGQIFSYIGDLASHLQNNTEIGFIRRVPGFGNRSKDSLYQLIDNFCLFHLRFIRDSAASLRGEWLQGAGTAGRSTWEGLAFEIVCLNHLEQIRRALGISGVQTRAYSWSCRGDDGKDGAQIDLLLDRAQSEVTCADLFA